MGDFYHCIRGRVVVDMTGMIPRYPFIEIETTPTDVEHITDTLWELGATGVEERDATTLDRPHDLQHVIVIGHFETEPEAQLAIEAFQRVHRTTLRYIEGDEWKTAWRAHYKPTRCGERLVIRPSWEPFEAQPGDVVLTLDPGAAFGTGTHETTQLMLRALDAHVRGGQRVLDVGCGSGILSIAALLLGATHVDAWDIDELSIAVTRENATFNHVEDNLDARVNNGVEWASSTAQSYDIVVANIELRVLEQIPQELSKCTKEGGVLMLSGLLSGQQDELRPYFKAFDVIDTPVDGEWVGLVLRKR